MNDIIQGIFVFAVGGVGYAILEILWRGKTHWSMVIAGGICMLLLFEIFGIYKNMSLISKALVGAAVITSVEFIAGCILNSWLKMDVWDYSDQKLNIMGQVCPMYTFLWGILSLPASWLCTLLRVWFERI